MSSGFFSNNRSKAIAIILVCLALGSILGLLFPLNGFLDHNADSKNPNSSKNLSDDRGDSNGGQNIPLAIFSSDETWESKEDWNARGVNIYKGEVSDQGFVMKGKTTFTHYARKYKFVKLEEIFVDIKIPDKLKSTVKLEVGTSNNRKAIAHLDLDADSILDSERYSISDGTNKISPDLSWGNFTFFKVTIDREDSSVQSPVVKNIEVTASPQAN